jgi:superfamily II DNA or RNA helicase
MDPKQIADMLKLLKVDIKVPTLGTIRDDIKAKLLPYQITHVIKLCNIIQTKFIALDGSDTGVGKTYSALAIASQMKFKVIIICPKSIMLTWLKLSKSFKVDVLDVVNYETLRGAQSYTRNFASRRNCTYLSRIDDLVIVDMFEYRWNIPEGTMVIFDEVHRCRDYKTLNFKLLTSIKSSITAATPILMLSATCSEHSEHTRYLFYLFGLISTQRSWKQFFRHQCSQQAELSENKIIHNLLYPSFACRIKISDLGNKFPSDQITGMAYHIEDYDGIEKQYDEIETCRARLKRSDPMRDNMLVRILRARQMIELYKVPTMIELAQEFLDNHLSVVIFVNFKESMSKIIKHFQPSRIVSIIRGDQKLAERTKGIDLFQSNECALIVCQIDAGGDGISLHDIHGGHPRASIISPTWSATKLIQALGRIPRAESKSPCLQRIVFAARTIEEYVCDKLNSKISSLKEINDGDLDVFSIT